MFDSSLFIGESYFNNDGAKIDLILQLIYYTSGLAVKKLTIPTTSNNGLAPSVKGYEKLSFYTSKYNNFSIVCKLDSKLNSAFTLKAWLFGGVKLAKNAGYGFGFNSRSEVLLPDDSVGRNIITFEAY